MIPLTHHKKKKDVYTTLPSYFTTFSEFIRLSDEMSNYITEHGGIFPNHTFMVIFRVPALQMKRYTGLLFSLCSLKISPTLWIITAERRFNLLIFFLSLMLTQAWVSYCSRDNDSVFVMLCLSSTWTATLWVYENTQRGWRAYAIAHVSAVSLLLLTDV